MENKKAIKVKIFNKTINSFQQNNKILNHIQIMHRSNIEIHLRMSQVFNTHNSKINNKKGIALEKMIKIIKGFIIISKNLKIKLIKKDIKKTKYINTKIYYHNTRKKSSKLKIIIQNIN